jgi:flagellar hook assembly protein FlgD
MFEHNRPGDEIDVTIQIFTVSGKVVKTLHEKMVTDGYRVDNLHWDGRDEYGDKIGRGVYVYKVNVRGSDGNSAHQFEKLVLLQ